MEHRCAEVRHALQRERDATRSTERTEFLGEGLQKRPDVCGDTLEGGEAREGEVILDNGLETGATRFHFSQGLLHRRTERLRQLLEVFVQQVRMEKDGSQGSADFMGDARRQGA